jgi:protein CpxP
MYKVLSNKVLLFISAILLVSNIVLIIMLLRMKNSHKQDFGSDNQRYPVPVFLNKEVGFSPEQMDQYEKIRRQQRQRMRPLFEDMRVAKVQFYRHLSDPAGENDSLLNQAAAVIGGKQQAIELHAYRNFKEIRGVCTDRQKPKYDSLIAGVIEKMWFPPRKPGPPERK